MRSLIVEDELLIAMDIQSILTAEGFTVLGPFASVEKALHLLKDNLTAETPVLRFAYRGTIAFIPFERKRFIGLINAPCDLDASPLAWKTTPG